MCPATYDIFEHFLADAKLFFFVIFCDISILTASASARRPSFKILLLDLFLPTRNFLELLGLDTK